MTGRSASKFNTAFGSSEAFIHGAKPSAETKSAWREDARRSVNARIGGLKDFARERRWPVLAAVAIVALSGAGVVASVGGSGSDQADALDKAISEKNKRVASLDADRKRHEDRLAELQKQINARESQIAESEERVAALEKRRVGLERQVAELVAPVSGGHSERVDDVAAPLPEPRDLHASSADDAGSPPDESAGRKPSTAQVDDHVAAESARAHAPSAERIRVSSRKSASVEDAALSDREAVGPVRVFIHVRSADPRARERAAAIAAELQRRGLSVAEIRGVMRPVRRDAVRYFYDQDRDAIPGLQDAVRSVSPRAGAPEVKDFRSYGAPPRQGTIELWLS